MRANKNTIWNSQNGFASIIIAIVLVLVLSLITVGFAQLMRREQRQALDKQLSSQAYYAAESGINLASKAVEAGYKGTKPDCEPIKGAPVGSPEANFLSSNNVGPTDDVDNSTGAFFPCLLIDPQPKTLEYNPVRTSESKFFEMLGIDRDGNPARISTITISWQDTDSRNTSFVDNCNNLYPASGDGTTWNDGGHNYTGILRVDLVSVASLSRKDLVGNMFTAFLCPNNGGGGPIAMDYDRNKGSGSGAIINGNCTTASTKYCTIKITNLQALNQSGFFMNLRSIYHETAVTVRAYGGDGLVNPPNELRIGGAQTLVDSTGKAQDVLRRVQVRIPSQDTYATPIGTAASHAICKQLKLGPEGNGGNACD